VPGPRLRTSASDPIRIDEVVAGERGGVIGVTFCPGKRDPPWRWHRTLADDLARIAEWRPHAVVTLIEDHEFDLLGVRGLGDAVRALGIPWHHLPIPDVQPPDERFETAWHSAGPKLRDTLAGGGKVLVHCRGGCGRAGMVAARLLVELNEAPRDAVRRVRAARPCAIETPAQMEYVLGHEPTRRRRPGPD
jgi:protein-tyrosine phosphatase